MILDKDTASVLTVKDWPTLADIRTGVVKRDRDEETGLDLIFMKNPSSLGDDSMVAISHSVAALRDGMMRQGRGLYPAGEGAGYAGGIVSAAIDGTEAALRLGGDYGY